MKTKTIRKVIRAKMTDWMRSINNDVVIKTINDNAIITGGAIASMILNEKVNDYDVYFKTAESALIVAEHYAGDRASQIFIDEEDGQRVRVYIKSWGVDGITEEEVAENAEVMETAEIETEGKKITPYSPLFITENAITLSSKVQLITRFTGNAKDIHVNFDYLHATGSYDYKDDTLHIPDGVYECLINRELRYVGSLYPFASIVRMRKFIRRGWQINAGEILKMCLQLNELNLTDPKVLQDQLTGVDASYFAELFAAIKDEKKLEVTYLVSVINRVLGN